MLWGTSDVELKLKFCWKWFSCGLVHSHVVGLGRIYSKNYDFAGN